MSLSLESNRVKFDSSDPPITNYRQTNWSVKWSIVLSATRAFFKRTFRGSLSAKPAQLSVPAPGSASVPRPVSAPDLASAPAISVYEKSGPFVAKEGFKRGADVVVFGDELYKWRDELNLAPTFIAMRDISIGEEVVNDPTDIEHSDLMIHWRMTYCPKDQ